MIKTKDKKYKKKLKAAYKAADKRLKDGTLKLEDHTSYIRGYMKEESKT